MFIQATIHSEGRISLIIIKYANKDQRSLDMPMPHTGWIRHIRIFEPLPRNWSPIFSVIIKIIYMYRGLVRFNEMLSTVSES